MSCARSTRPAEGCSLLGNLPLPHGPRQPVSLPGVQFKAAPRSACSEPVCTGSPHHHPNAVLWAPASSRTAPASCHLLPGGTSSSVHTQGNTKEPEHSESLSSVSSSLYCALLSYILGNVSLLFTCILDSSWWFLIFFF